MAWPPPTLPTTRTDTTVMATTHPADHNAANLAINDTVARVKTIVSGNAAYTSNTNALITIALPAGYATAPNVVAMNADPANLHYYILGARTTTTFQLIVAGETTNVGLVNTATRISYMVVPV